MKKIAFLFLPLLFFVSLFFVAEAAENKNAFFMPQNAMKNTTLSGSQLNYAAQKQLQSKKKSGNSVVNTAISDDSVTQNSAKKISSPNYKTKNSTFQKANTKQTTTASAKAPVASKQNAPSPKRTMNYVKKTAPKLLDKTPSFKLTPPKFVKEEEKQTDPKQLAKQDKIQPKVNPAPEDEKQSAVAPKVLEEDVPKISLQNPFDIVLEEYRKDLELIRDGKEIDNPNLNAMLNDYVDKEHIITVQ